MTDNELKYHVLAELCWEPMLNDAQIHVSVENGVVSLSGTVDNYTKRMAAENALKKISGITALAISIEVAKPPATAESDKQIAEAASKIFRWSEVVPDDRIHTSVSRGVVKLEGQVEWEFQRKAAEEAVKHLAGVQSVLNLILIRSSVKPQNVEENIRKAFQRHALIDANKISVHVEGHKVILEGRVRSLAEKEDAIIAAWKAPGIEDVEDRLVIELPESIYETEL